MELSFKVANGEKSVSASYEGKSDDESVQGYVTGRMRQSADGETTTEVEVKGKAKF